MLPWVGDVARMEDKRTTKCWNITWKVACCEASHTSLALNLGCHIGYCDWDLSSFLSPSIQMQIECFKTGRDNFASVRCHPVLCNAWTKPTTRIIKYTFRRKETDGTWSQLLTSTFMPWSIIHTVLNSRPPYTSMTKYVGTRMPMNRFTLTTNQLRAIFSASLIWELK
jgi:hypothetical protein